MSAEIPNGSKEQQQFNNRPEWFNAFLANTNQKIVQEAVLAGVFESRYPTLWKRIADPEYSLEILFAGGGTGESETLFALRVKKLRGEKGLENVSLYYEDVSFQMYERFKATARTHGIDHTVKEYSIHKFEDPYYVPPDVDIALGFQMWSYVRRSKDSVAKMSPLEKFAKTVQKKGGIAVLSLQSQEGDLHAVRGKRIPLFHGHPDLVAEEVQGELKNLGINFYAKTAEAVTDISSCFQEGKFDPTAEGKNILSFMLRASWDSLTEQQQQEVAEDIKKLVVKNGPEQLFFRDTYLFIPGD